MFICSCCNPAHVYSSSNSLTRHRRKKGIPTIHRFKQARNDYAVSPRKCKKCNNILTFAQRVNAFCSSSCAASVNLIGRKISEETRKKRSHSCKIAYKKSQKLHQPPQKARRFKCEQCQNEFTYAKFRKTCGVECLKKFNSAHRIAYLKNNAGTFSWTSGPSYFEQSFMKKLDEEGLLGQYIALTKHFYNHEKNTNYYLDIFFPDLLLNIELDGTHHRKPDIAARDVARDDFLSRCHNITIHRVCILAYSAKGGHEKCWDEALALIYKMKQTRRLAPVSAYQPCALA